MNMLAFESSSIKRRRLTRSRKLDDVIDYDEATQVALYHSLEYGESSLWQEFQEVPIEEEPILHLNENNIPNCCVLLKDLKDSGFVESHSTEKIKSPEIHTLGLPNYGNTCYVNSVLQVLRYTPDFLNTVHLLMKFETTGLRFCKEEDLSDWNFCKRLHSLYTAIWQQELLLTIDNWMERKYDKISRSMSLFMQSLRSKTSQFEKNEQHDAHELLITILSTFSNISGKIKLLKSDIDSSNALIPSSNSAGYTANDIFTVRKQQRKQQAKHRKVKNEKYPGTSDQTNTQRAIEKSLDSWDDDCLKSLFEGKLKSVVKCLECEHRLENEESFVDLEAPVFNESSDSVDDVMSVVDCLPQTTYATGDNKYFCGKCLRQNEAKISCQIIAPPPILVIHLNWLSKFSEVATDVRSNKINIPLTLEMTTKHEIFSSLENESYVLYAFISHIGTSSSGGHYVAFINVPIEHDLPAELQPINESESCCVVKQVSHLDLSESEGPNTWVLFDDEKVKPLEINTSSGNFPYKDYLCATATPCILFYKQVAASH